MVQLLVHALKPVGGVCDQSAVSLIADLVIRKDRRKQKLREEKQHDRKDSTKLVGENVRLLYSELR